MKKRLYVFVLLIVMAFNVFLVNYGAKANTSSYYFEYSADENAYLLLSQTAESRYMSFIDGEDKASLDLFYSEKVSKDSLYGRKCTKNNTLYMDVKSNFYSTSDTEFLISIVYYDNLNNAEIKLEYHDVNGNLKYAIFPRTGIEEGWSVSTIGITDADFSKKYQSSNLNDDTTMRIINGGDNIYRKIEIANISKLKRDNINTTMSTLRCDQANVLKKLQIIEQTDKMFDGENLSKQCSFYDLLYLYNICSGNPDASISQAYKSKPATQKDVLSRFIGLLEIQTNYTSLVRCAEEAGLITTDDFFLFDNAKATYYNLLSVVYNSVFYDPKPNNETNELPIFENLLESGRLYGIGISGIRELKNNAMLDIYLYKDKVCPAQEVEGADGRTFKFVNYYGEMLYRPYFTQQQWSDDGNSFVCCTYDSVDRIYRIYLYNVETETIKYLDSGFSECIVCNGDYVYFLKKTEGIYTLWKNSFLNDEPSELIYTFADGIAPSMPHISNDGRYISFECSDSEYKNFPRPANTKALVRLDLQTLEFKYTYYSYNYSNIINHVQVNPMYSNLLYFCHETDTANGFTWTDIQERASIMDLDTNGVIHIPQGLIENSNSNMLLFTHEYWSADGEYLYITNLLGQGEHVSPNGIVRVNKDGSHRKYYYSDLIKPKYEGGLGLRSNHSYASGDNEYFAIDCEWVYIMRADTNQVFPICDTSFYTKGHPYHPHPVIAKNKYIVNWGMILEDGILGISWYDFTDLDKYATGGRYKINDYVENVRYKENRDDYPELSCDSSTDIMGNKECLFAENGKNIYLDVNENIVDSTDEAVMITFEYYDNSFEPIVVTYTKGAKNDNDLCKFENMQIEIERTGTNTWKTAQVNIESGNFENIGTFDSDFYITGKNSDVYIANIKVEKSQYDSVCINVDTVKNDVSYNFKGTLSRKENSIDSALILAASYNGNMLDKVEKRSVNFSESNKINFDFSIKPTQSNCDVKLFVWNNYRQIKPLMHTTYIMDINLNATQKANGVSLTWEAIDGVETYEVYRDGKRIAITSELFYNDKYFTCIEELEMDYMNEFSTPHCYTVKANNYISKSVEAFADVTLIKYVTKPEDGLISFGDNEKDAYTTVLTAKFASTEPTDLFSVYTSSNQIESVPYIDDNRMIKVFSAGLGREMGVSYQAEENNLFNIPAHLSGKFYTYVFDINAIFFNEKNNLFFQNSGGEIKNIGFVKKDDYIK